MTQQDAKKIIDSKIIDKVVAKVKEKFFKEFCKEKPEDIHLLHSYGVATDKVAKELNILLTNYANKGKFQLMSENVFRKQYVPLTDDEQFFIGTVKDKAFELYKMIDTKQCQENSIAKTKLEESVMWAVKGFTS